MRARSMVLMSFVLSIAAGPNRAWAQQPQHAGSLSLGAGSFNMGHADRSSGVGLEYRFTSHPWKPAQAKEFALVPTIGVIGTSKDALFGYAGFRTDLDVTERWRVTPGFSVGAYERNGDINLGGPVEFRSSLDVSRRIGNGPRVGLTLYHISNARLYQRNPGVNALAFVQTF